MSSDVCKHCTHAACLDVCPTGALFRTEFGTVVVQDDICNGCGYCVPACPYGVIDQREDDGRACKCTLCYDRLGDGLDAGLREGLPDRVDPVRRRSTSCASGPTAGVADAARSRASTEARLYGDDPDDGVGGDGAFFLLLDEPEVYGLPPDPVVTTRDLPRDVAARRASAAARRWPAPRSSRRSWAAPMTAAGDRGAGAAAASGRWCPTPSSRSYYGRPILKAPTWKAPDIPATCSSAAWPAPRRCWPPAPTLTGRPALRRGRPARRARRDRRCRVGALVHDLGRPARFLNMLRVFKPTSPMSVGSWILAAFGPLAGRRRGVRELTGIAARASGAAAAARRRPCSARPSRPTPRCCSPTPPCRPGTRRTASCRSCSPARAASAAGGLGLLAAAPGEAGPARRLAVARRGASSSSPSGGSIRRLAAARAGMPWPSPTDRAGPARLMRRRRGADRRRPGRRAARAAQPGRCRAVRRGAAGRLGADPVRRLRGRHGLGPGPEVHGRAPAAPAPWTPAATRAE